MFFIFIFGGGVGAAPKKKKKKKKKMWKFPDDFLLDYQILILSAGALYI